MKYYGWSGEDISMEEWSRRMELPRHVGDDYLQRGSTRIRVSTVWLGLDHGMTVGTPLIFETMVFMAGKAIPDNGSATRAGLYSNPRAALKGHRDVLWAMRRLRPPHKVLIHNGKKPR